MAESVKLNRFIHMTTWTRLFTAIFGPRGWQP